MFHKRRPFFCIKTIIIIKTIKMFYVIKIMGKKSETQIIKIKREKTKRIRDFIKKKEIDIIKVLQNKRIP
jgi:hypothetical protein